MAEGIQKTILVGVTGCIAAYKSCELVRALQKAGLRVKVVMTPHATEFVGPTTFRALTHEPVAVGLFDEPGDPIHHVSLAQECDAFLIAPCTANVIAKIACGIADDLLTTTALATRAPLIIAPAMNVNMYENVATQTNIERLKARGVHFVEPDEGYLACGDSGKGRLADVQLIANAALDALELKLDLAGKHVLITAGPTQEPIDPVRYISNPSSGKTGFALARAAVARGAHVTLVTGPVSLGDVKGAQVIRVQTALQMKEAVDKAFPKADIAIFSAAVSDMRPKNPASQKLKKGENDAELASIALVKNPDILAECGARKNSRQIVVGFAAETNDVLSNAKKKLTSKHADFIVANKVGDNLGFGADANKVTFVSPEGLEECELVDKDTLADLILDKACEFAK